MSGLIKSDAELSQFYAGKLENRFSEENIFESLTRSQSWIDVVLEDMSTMSGREKIEDEMIQFMRMHFPCNDFVPTRSQRDWVCMPNSGDELLRKFLA